MKKILIIAGIILALFLVYYIFLRSKSTAKTEYDYSVIKKDTIVRKITATGTLNASETIDVGTQVSGIVSEVFVDYNDIVEKGQVIAMIDTVTLATSVVEQEANVLKAKAQLIQSEKEYKRYTDLLAKKAVSQSEYDQVKAEYLSAQSTLKSAQAQLSKAKINLKYATITAPISGIVISRDISVGQTVAASFSTPKLFTIANDLSKMQLNAKIDEADIGYIKTGQAVTFTVDAYPDEEFSGTVEQIRLQPTTTQNVVTYSVIIDAPNTDLKLLPGMSANLSIEVEEHADVLTVPLSSIFFNPESTDTSLTDNTQTTIWMLCNDKSSNGKEYNGVFMQPVVVFKGFDDGSLVEVSGNDIKIGDTVIIGTKDVATEKKKGLLNPPKGGPPKMD
jgi:HlyD family secretion protein